MYDIGDLIGDQEDCEITLSDMPHTVATFDSACKQNSSAEGFEV